MDTNVQTFTASADAAIAALEQTGCPAMLLNSIGRIVRMNALAEAICKVDDGLSVEHGVLIAGNKETQQTLHHTLTSASSATLAIKREYSERPYLLQVAPFANGLTLVTIRDLDAILRPKANEDYAKCFGLTNKEWQVARTLVVSQDEHEVAEKMKVSVNTIQTHRKRIYSKLDICSRTELTIILAG